MIKDRLIELMYLLWILMLLALLFYFKDITGQTLSGSGTWADPYLITNADDLNDVRNYPLRNSLVFKLTNDIDLSGYSPWIPIGTSLASGWKNYFDGNNKTIRNLTLTNASWTANREVGLFGTCNGQSDSSTIKNLTIEDVSIDVATGSGNDYYVGVLAGQNGYSQGHYSIDSLVIRNVTIRVDANTSVPYALWVGGVTGRLDQKAQRVAVENMDLYVKAGNVSSLTDGSRGVGGVFGAVSQKIDQIKFEGRVEINSPALYTGGIVGRLMVGGISMSNLYARGKVISSNYTRVAGGLIGHLSTSSAVITNSYAQLDTVYVYPDNTNAGVLIAYAYYSATFTNIFGDVQNSNINKTFGYIKDVGATDSSGTGKSTAWMQTKSNYTAAGWDFTNIWEMANDGYPKFQWEIKVIPNSLVLELPLGGESLNPGDSLLVRWTGTGNYDSVDVNGTTVQDTFYYYVIPDTVGSITITVTLLAEPLIFEQRSVTIYSARSIIIDTCYTAENKAYIKVLTSGWADYGFYIGQDSVTMIYLGGGSPGIKIKDSLYTFDLPFGYFINNGTYYKVIEERDAVKRVSPKTINNIGQYGGSLICWYPEQSIPIEVTGILDFGCGWVSRITKRYTTAFLVLSNTTEPSLSLTYNACTDSCARDPNCPDCDWMHYTYLAIDTLLADTTIVNYKNSPYFNNKGAAGVISYNGRTYYLSGSNIYTDDLINGIDSVKVAELPASAVVESSSLWLFEYETNKNVIKYATGEFASAMPKLDSAKIIIYDNADFQRAYYFNAYPPPVTAITPIYDIYQSFMPTVYTQNYFRGIRPKATKHGKVGI